MADLQLDKQNTPTTPSADTGLLYIDTTTEKLVVMDDGGNALGRLSRNFSTASQGAGFSTDTYVTSSGILIPHCGLQAGMVFRWLITGSKTAASTATPIYVIRLGTNQTTADTAILTLTTAAQTAVADNGLLTITALLRNVGAAGVLAGVAAWAKTQTGLIGFGGSIDGVSAGFDTTSKGGNYMGLSINGGTSAAWTLTTVHGELLA